jgi:Family of unknown function (DUF6338)
MIPSTLLAAILFAASIGPGYVWIRVAERRAARPARTGLLEAAELIFVGSVASTVSFLVVIAIAAHYSWFDSNGFASQGHKYLLRHPSASLAIAVAGLTLAYTATWVVARIVHFRQLPTIGLGFSGWYRALTPRQKDVRVWVTADLRDGSTITGWYYGTTVEEVEPEKRDLLLAALPATRPKPDPIRVRPAGAERFMDLPDNGWC